MRSASFLVVCLVLFAAGSARAQDQPQTPPVEKPTGQATPTDDAGGEKQDVRAYTLSPERYEKAVAYSRAGYRLYFINVAYSLLLLLMILKLRVAPRFRNLAERTSRRRVIQVVVFAPLFLLLYDALQFPLDAYGHDLAVRYGISIQGWGGWLWDWAKSELIKITVLTVVLYFFYGLIRRSPRRWWLYSGLAAFPLIVFFVFLAPLVIDPLFNKFEPLENNHPALVTEIEKVIAHGGLEIPRERIFEMKASEKVRALNAYVTGFGASKRVVVWDTTIQNMTAPQTLFVVGHEMGHYVLGHIPKGVAFTGLFMMLILYVVHRAVNWTLERWQRRWGLIIDDWSSHRVIGYRNKHRIVNGLGDWASLPALMFFFSLFFFLAGPLLNTFSRYQEHQSDVYGLEVTHGVMPDSARAAAEAFQILGEVDLADPHPSAFIKFWLYSHPPLAERLAFAREYDPWTKGEPTEFVPAAQ
jgi:STE24 endopeptidase